MSQIPDAAVGAPAGVIGTAGHVDHGKTALVRALTGVDTDRLAEEKRRGISIDLGFAALILPSGQHAAVVDVPGHERFVRNMVAGASGIDLALLLVASDAGVMPQTREHVAIMQLLGVTEAVVALSKADLVQEDWLSLVTEEVHALLDETPFASAPILPVSARTGQGLPALLGALASGLGKIQRRPAHGPARIPIDRVFSVAGFGTVVTGTMTSGSVTVEERLELVPTRRTARIRGLQVHGRPVGAAFAGQRVAANLSGIARSDVQRGDVLATPGSLVTTDQLAVRLHTLSDSAHPMTNGQRLHLHLGTAEVLCRATLLAEDALDPGASGYAVLRLERPSAASPGDRFILRSYSPVRTLGGGLVLEVARRFRRHRTADLEVLTLIEQGDPQERIMAVFRAQPPLPIGTAAQRVGRPEAETQTDVDHLVAQGRLVALGPTASALYMAEPDWARLRWAVLQTLAAHHAAHPLRTGMPRGELRGKAMAVLDPRMASVVLSHLADHGDIQTDGEWVALAGYRPQLSGDMVDVAERIVHRVQSAGLQPPSMEQVATDAGFVGSAPDREELLAYLVQSGRLVRIDATLYCASGPLQEAIRQVRAYLDAHQTMTVAELRDLLGITRKYAVPLAEHLDGIGVTRRTGDVRRRA